MCDCGRSGIRRQDCDGKALKSGGNFCGSVGLPLVLVWHCLLLMTDRLLLWAWGAMECCNCLFFCDPNRRSSSVLCIACAKTCSAVYIIVLVVMGMVVALIVAKFVGVHSCLLLKGQGPVALSFRDDFCRWHTHLLWPLPLWA